MGVDFYACENCGDIYSDCGDYFTCTGCEVSFCSFSCAKAEYLDEDSEDGSEKTSCLFCRHDVATDRQVLLFLCKKYNVLLEDVTKEYLEDLKNGK